MRKVGLLLAVLIAFWVPTVVLAQDMPSSAVVTLPNGKTLVGVSSPPSPPSSGSENLHTIDAASVSFGGNRPMSEHERIVSNDVTFTARHCQAYGHKKGFLFHKHFVVDNDACAADPSTVYFVENHPNLRTNAGGDWQASVMANTAAPPATANYIALSNDATAPSTSDTTLASEIATNGLSRAQGVYAHTNGTASFTVQKVFSATGTQASQKAGLFNASSSGTLVFENTYTQVTVNNGDTLTVTWTVNY